MNTKKKAVKLLDNKELEEEMTREKNKDNKKRKKEENKRMGHFCSISQSNCTLIE